MLFLFPHVLQCPTHQVMYLRDVQSLILFMILLPTLLSHSECDSGPGDESNKARLPPHSNNLGQQLQRREFSRKYKLPPGLSPLWKQVANCFCQKILLKVKRVLFILQTLERGHPGPGQQSSGELILLPGVVSRVPGQSAQQVSASGHQAQNLAIKSLYISSRRHSSAHRRRSSSNLLHQSIRVEHC